MSRVMQAERLTEVTEEEVSPPHGTRPSSVAARGSEGSGQHSQVQRGERATSKDRSGAVPEFIRRRAALPSPPGCPTRFGAKEGLRPGQPARVHSLAKSENIAQGLDFVLHSHLFINIFSAQGKGYQRRAV